MLEHYSPLNPALHHKPGALSLGKSFELCNKARADVSQNISLLQLHFLQCIFKTTLLCRAQMKTLETTLISTMLTTPSSSYLSTGTFEDLSTVGLPHKTEYHCLFEDLGCQKTILDWFLCSLCFPSHNCGILLILKEKVS